MVGSVGLYGEVLVTWWGVGLHDEVLGYMVESVRLHDGECSITWGMLNYMEGSVRLPGDSSIRERLFNTGWVGVVRNIWSMAQRKLHPPLCT